MRKISHMLKRTMAVFLAALMVMTAGNFGFVFSAFAHDAGYDHEHVSLSDLIVNAYGKLTEDEKLIIKSGQLQGDADYHYVVPDPDNGDGRIAVDEESKTITAGVYTDKAGNKWYPDTFEVIVDDNVEESGDISTGTAVYEYDGNAFSVKITYVLEKEVSEEDQQAVLNAGSLLALDIAKLMLFEADIIPEKPEGWDEMTQQDKEENFTEEELAEYAKHDALQEFVDSALGKGADEDTLLTPELILSILVLPALDWEVEEDGQTVVKTLSAIELIALLGAGMTEEVTGIPEELIEDIESDFNKLEWDGETLSAELGFNNANNKVINRLVEEKTLYGNLLLGKFLMTAHQNDSYLEWLMVPTIYAELVEAVNSNYKDLNQLATNSRALDGVLTDMKYLLTDLELIEGAAWDMISTTAAEYGLTIENETQLNAALTDEGFDELLASQMGPLNAQLPALKEALEDNGYATEAASIPEEITTKAQLEALIATLKGVKSDAESKQALALEMFNSELETMGYDGSVAAATLAADIAAVENWLADEIDAQEALITAAITAANDLLEDTEYTGTVGTADPAADIEAAINWLIDNAGDELKAAQQVVAEKLAAAEALAEGFGYDTEANPIVNSAGVDAVAAWLQEQIDDKQAELDSYIAMANSYITEANKELPEGQKYTGTIATFDDIDGVIAWMGNQVTAAEDAYADALTTLNTTLDNAGYTGADVTSSADIEGVKTWLDNALAAAKTQYNNALSTLNTELDNAGYTGADVTSSADIADVKTDVAALFDGKKAEAQAQIDAGLSELNGTLGYYGYTGSVAKSTDVAAAVTYMENEAEDYIWGQVNAQLQTLPFPYNQYTVNSDNAASVQTALNQIGQTAAAAAIGTAINAVNNIPNIVTALNTTEANLEEAEAGLAAIDTKKVETLAALDTAYTNLKTAEEKIAETEAALPGLKAQLDEAYAQMVEGEQKIADAQAMVTEYTGTLNAAKATMANMEQKISDAEAALPGQVAQLNAAKADIVAAEEALANVNDPSATVIPALRAEQSKITAAKAAIAGYTADQAAVDTWESTLTQVGDAIATLSGAITQMEAGLAAADEAYATLESVAENLKMIKETKAELESTISMLDILITMLELFCGTIEDVNTSCTKNDWNVREVLVDYNEDYYTANPAVYDTLTAAATGLTAPAVEVTESLHVTEADVTYKMSMWDVTVEYTAVVIDPSKVDSTDTVSLTTVTKKVTLVDGATKQEILDAIAAKLPAEDTYLANWGISADNYDRAVTELPETLTENVTYTVSYAPKMLILTLDNTFEGEIPEQVPYGYRMTLPAHDDVLYEWEYTVGEQTKIRQGTVVTLTEDTAITRKAGAASEQYKLTDLVIETTPELTANEKAILQSLALKLNKVVYVRMPNGSLVTVVRDSGLGKTTVTAEPYDSNVAGDWTVSTGLMDGTPVEFQNGVFTTTEVFNQIVASYKLSMTAGELGLTAAELEEYLNAPYILSTDYHFQKNTLDTLVAALTIDDPMDEGSDAAPLEALQLLRRDYEVPFNGQNLLLGNLLGSLPTLNNSLGMGLSQTTLDAAAALLDILPEEGNVPLYDTLMLYQSNNGGMEHYYKNETTYINQITQLSSLMNALTADATLMGMLGGYKAQFDAINNALNAAAALGEEENRIRTDLININSPFLSDLLAALEEGNVAAHAAPSELEWTVNITKAGPTSKSYSVKVDVFGNVKSDTYVVGVDDSYDHAADHLTILNANNMIKAEDMMYYEYAMTEDVDGEGNPVYTYTYSYKWFAVGVQMDGQDVYLGSVSMEQTVITLPVHPDSENFRWDYVVDGKAYSAGGDVELTTNQFKALVNGELSITRTLVDLEAERLEQEEEEKRKQEQQLISELGALGVMTKLEEGKYALVLNLNLDDPTESLMGFIVGMVTSPYEIYLGSTDLYTTTQYTDKALKQIHLQALIDLLLYSDLTDDDLLGMMANGAFKNDFTLPGAYIETAPYGDLGTLLTQSTLTFRKADKDDLVVDFYVTLSGSGSTVATLQDTLNKLPEGVGMTLTDGGVSLSAGLPGIIYTAYLAALTMVGEVDVDTVQSANSEVVIGYMLELLDPVIDAEGVTLTTISNTLAQFGVNVDLSAYEGYFNTFKGLYDLDNVTYTENGFVMALNDIDISSLINELQGMVDGMELPGGIKLTLATLIYEYNDPNYADDEYGLDVKLGVGLDNVAAEYDVIFVEPKADGVANKVGMTTVDKLNLSATSVVILVNDIDGDLVFNGTTTFVDLNGFTVSGNIVANGGDVIVVDSDYTADGGANGVSGAVTVLGGKYAETLAAENLGEGYAQAADGTVGNKLFTVAETDSAITVTLNATPEAVKSFMSERGVIELAAEVLMELVINHYNAAALSMDGNTIYNINFNDLIALASGDMSDLVDTALACFSASDLAEVFNAIVDDLTDYAGMAEALAEGGDGIVSEHSFTTATWAIALGHDAVNDVLTVNMGSSTEHTTTKALRLAVVGDARDDMATLSAAMADTVTVESELDLDDIVRTDGMFIVNGSYEGSVVIDFASNPGYVLAMSVILADGTTDSALKADLVDGIEAFAETGDAYALSKVFNALTIEDICDALVNHIDEFDDMVAGLGLSAEAEAAVTAKVTANEMGYALLVDVVSYALFLLDSYEIGESITNSGRTLGSFEKTDANGDKYYGFEKSGSVDKTVSVVEASMDITNVSVKLYMFKDHTCADNDNDHLCDICDKQLSLCADGDDDHLCDHCGEKISLCADGDNDHLCDLCGEKISNCADAAGDGDHLCDICGEVCGLCSDSDDHYCDECGEKISNCSDADGDNDHLCDVCGEVCGLCSDSDDHYCDECGEKISNCSDAAGDGDHDCDICGEVMGLCSDSDTDNDHNCDECGNRLGLCSDAANDGDHLCDVCGEVCGLCSDSNDDHKCDECGDNTSFCTDAANDGDHLCDICGEVCGLCADSDDHYCDECGEKISNCSDAANDGDHLCDVCGEVMGLCSDSDDHYCDECGEKISNCSDAANDGDHKCDLCGEVMGLCSDSDGDHYCDECNEKISNCSDAAGDGDHLCDVCGEVIGLCSDSDDHYCDECNEKISNCADANSDHKCDTCGEKISNCSDAANDGNHDCDICGEVCGLCSDSDTDNDHNCDECGNRLSLCSDANNDHKCDTCGEEISLCADANNDHKCDTCGKEISLCADANSDHKCDTCGKEISLCADANNDHKCDTCGKEISLCADANSDHKCDTCGEKISNCVDANGDYYCDICGEPVGEKPVVGVPEIPVSDSVLGFKADDDAGLLYLDVVQTGMTVEAFTALLKTHVDTEHDADDVCDVTVVGDVNGLIATGTQVTVTAKNPLGVASVTYDIVLMGDTNCNGRIESGDAVKVANHYYGDDLLTGLALLAGDTNCNGRIESGDAVKIRIKYIDGDNYVTGLTPVEQ